MCACVAHVAQLRELRQQAEKDKEKLASSAARSSPDERLKARHAAEMRVLTEEVSCHPLAAACTARDPPPHEPRIACGNRRDLTSSHRV